MAIDVTHFNTKPALLVHRTASSRRSDNPGALNRLKAFSSIRRHPVSVQSTSLKVNPSVQHNNQQLNNFRTASKVRHKINSNDIEGGIATRPSRNALQISKSLHDVPEFCIVKQMTNIEEAQDDDNDIRNTNQ